MTAAYKPATCGVAIDVPQLYDLKLAGLLELPIIDDTAQPGAKNNGEFEGRVLGFTIF